MAIEVPHYENPNTPASGRTTIFANTAGNIATKDALGNVRVYRPTPLESEGMIYGVRWDSVNDVMTPGVVVAGSFVATDYQNFPIQEDCGRGLLTDTNVWTKLNARDTTRHIDGTAATVDGSAGQVMVQIPRFHQVIMRSGDFVFFLVSKTPFTYSGVTSWVPLGFRDKAFRYAGAFQGVALTDAVEANVGSCILNTTGYTTNTMPNPFTNRTRAQFRAQCVATGSNVFHQYDYGLHEIIGILFLTKYKTWNSQSVLPGNTEQTGTWDYSMVRPAGLTSSLGDFDGSIWDSTISKYVANSFLGIENFFGNVWVWADGINIDNQTGPPTGDCRVWVNFTPSAFADDTDGGGYIDSGHAPAFGDTSAYIKDILGQGKYCPFYPSTLGSGADASRFITDHHWNAAGIWRVLTVGGTANNGGPAGLFAFNASFASGTTSSSRGARLAA